MDKLKETLELQERLQRQQAAFEAQLRTAQHALGEAMARKSLGITTYLTVEAAQQQVDSLSERMASERLQLAALPGIISELKSSTTNDRAPDRHEQVRRAQETYKRLMTKLTLRAHRTSDPAVTPEVLRDMNELYQAGATLRNTARVADTIETWGVGVRRNNKGEMIGFADESQQYGNWNPPAPAKPKTWAVLPFAQFAKRLRVSEKRLRDLFAAFQQERFNGSAVSWHLLTRQRFDQFQDWIEDGDYAPPESFHPPLQKNLAEDLGVSERSLRNRFVQFKQTTTGVANGYVHLTEANYQKFLDFIRSDTRAESAVVR